MKALAVNHENFDQTVLASPRPVLVDFWAEWCGPCKMIAPLLDEVAAEQSGKSAVAKLNIDESPGLAAQFGITSIPTLIVFNGGKPVKTFRGVTSKSALTAALASAQNP